MHTNYLRLGVCPITHPHFLAKCDLRVSVRLGSGSRVKVGVRVKACILHVSRCRRLGSNSGELMDK